MHLLPLSLGRLAEHADRPSFGHRYATDSVFLRLTPGNTFEAVATDTKVLARVTGPCVDSPEEHFDIPGFATQPAGATTALIPADFWRSSFAFAKKLTTRTNLPALRCLAVRLSETETSFAATNGVSPWTSSAPNNTGRFPPYDNVIAGSTRPRTPREHFAVDPRLLAELLRTATDFCDQPALPEVQVEPPGLNAPIVVRTGRRDGTQFFGLVMPLFEAPATKGDSDERGSVAGLEQRCADLEAERDALLRQVRELKLALGRQVVGDGKPAGDPGTEWWRFTLHRDPGAEDSGG